MRLSNLADYAVVTMSAAARHCGGGRTSAAELASETGLPVPTVQKVVSKLSAAGLLRSTRGAGGGLQLARPAAAISLADIVEAVEGPIALTSCIEGGGECAVERNCAVKPHWPLVNSALRGALAGISLVQLARTPTDEPVQAPVAHEQEVA
ncbi:SUF system Fe-S cluster assembly regulator [Erythrobacter sp. EC-HK427]|uniref:SUF system Fe-S cluster assembly regulator n=1 Tax=Erythrobacter sp. EC-HK427 TaxID=2038396 RepID=UPI00125ED11F|nr:SUF system Fe-S cluster assembly regulator [Erythrobacter sp. EC-HK427]